MTTQFWSSTQCEHATTSFEPAQLSAAASQGHPEVVATRVLVVSLHAPMYSKSCNLYMLFL